MAEAETLKQTIAQAVAESAKAMIVAVNEESRRQTMGSGHHNTANVMRSQSGGSSLSQLMLEFQK